MATTPQLWLEATVPSSHNGQMPSVVAIGGGQFVVVWNEAAAGPVGTAAGADIVGQIYDFGGNLVGSPFQVNSAFSSDDETNSALAAASSGGFLVAYQEVSGTNSAIRVEGRDVTGAVVGGATATIAAFSSDTLTNPTIAVKSDGSYLVAYNRNGDVVARLMDATGSLGSEFVVANNSHDPHVSVLADGRFVVGFEKPNVAAPFDLDPVYVIVAPSGATSGPFTIDNNLDDQSDVHVAGLTGGGFATVWTENVNSSDEVFIKTFDASGAPSSGSTLVDFGNHPELVSLSDGTFVLEWERSGNGRNTPSGERFSANGQPIGQQFGDVVLFAHGNTSSNPAVATLSDGRIVIAYQLSNPFVFTADVALAIYDGRTGPITGTSGNDVLAVSADHSSALGLDGNDVIYGSSSGGSLNGGAGDDTLIGRTGETLIGGSGSDQFVSPASRQVLTIDDYRSGEDHIGLNHAGYGINATGTLAQSGIDFLVGSSVTVAHPTIVYDPINFMAVWQPDGNPSNNVTIAVIDPGKSTTWQRSQDLGMHATNWSIGGLGDFNHDGTSDIIWRSAVTGQVDQWQMQDGNWSRSIDLGANKGTDWQLAGIGDFNNDGTSDVLWRNTATSQVDQWQMLNGNWSNSIDLGANKGADWLLAGVGDFNGDGTDDVLWRNLSTGQVDEWIMLNGNWSRSVDLGSRAPTWTVAGIGDFGGDGTDDVLWRNASTAQVDEWQMKNGNWLKSVDLGSNKPADWDVAGVGDLNGNGVADILWRNSGSGITDAWIMKGGNWAASAALGGRDTSTQSAGVADFNGDDVSDVLWHNPNNGQTDTWQLLANVPNHASDYLIV